MNWSELLTKEIESTYAVTKGLLDLADDEMLQWKPATGSNWMTTGQLLKHITIACGGSMRGFVTGDWGLPEGVDVHSLTTEEMLAPAETMQVIGSVAEAKTLLEEDERLALSLVSECSEEDLDSSLGFVRSGSRASSVPDDRSFEGAQGATVLLPEIAGQTGSYR